MQSRPSDAVVLGAAEARQVTICILKACQREHENLTFPSNFELTISTVKCDSPLPPPLARMAAWCLFVRNTSYVSTACSACEVTRQDSRMQV